MTTDPDRRVRRTVSLRAAVFATALTVALSGGVYAVAASSGGTTIRGCVNRHTGALSVSRHCTRQERRLDWNTTGPRGLQGLRGNPGTTGAPAAAYWERVEPGTPGGGAFYKPATSHTPAGVTIGGQHLAVGQYSVSLSGSNPPNISACSWTATAEGSGADAPDASAVTALVGSGIQVNIYDSAGNPVDDGFTTAIFCP